MLTEETKIRIQQGMLEYMKRHSVSQNSLELLTGVSTTNISYIVRGIWNATPSSGGTKTTKIGDQIFLKLQKGLGLTLDFFELDNYMAVEGVCSDAKELHQCRIVDGLTGTGKSFAVQRYVREYPGETYLVQCGNMMNALELGRALAKAVGVNEAGTCTMVVQRVGERLLRDSKPLLLIDETEALFRNNGKPETGFGLIKDLYDIVKDRAGIVLLGSNRFVEKLAYRADRLRYCFPQLLSRFGTDSVELALPTRTDIAQVAPAFGLSAKREQDALFDSTDSADFRKLFNKLRAVQADAALEASRVMEAA